MITIPKRNDVTITLNGVTKTYPDFDTISGGSMDGSPDIYFDAGFYTLNVGWAAGVNNDVWFSRFNLEPDGYIMESSIAMTGDPIAGSDAFCRLYSPGNETLVYLAPQSFNTFSASVDFIFAPIANCPLDAGTITETGTVSLITPVPGAPIIAMNTGQPSPQQSDGLSYWPAVANNGVFDGYRIFAGGTDGSGITIYNVAALPVIYDDDLFILGVRNLGGDSRLIFCGYTKSGGEVGFLGIECELQPFNNGVGSYVQTITEYELDDPALTNEFATFGQYAISTSDERDAWVMVSYPDGVHSMYAVEIGFDFSYWDLITFDAADADAQTILNNYDTGLHPVAYGLQGDNFLLACGDFSPFVFTSSAWWVSSTSPVPYGGGAPTNPLKISNVILLPCYASTCPPLIRKGKE